MKTILDRIYFKDCGDGAQDDMGMIELKDYGVATEPCYPYQDFCPLPSILCENRNNK